MIVPASFDVRREPYRRLLARLAAAMEAQTGQPFSLFRDMDPTPWPRISPAIAESAIPIMRVSARGASVGLFGSTLRSGCWVSRSPQAGWSNIARPPAARLKLTNGDAAAGRVPT